MTLKLLVRRFGAGAAAADGIMNIASALYPAIPSRMELLRDLLPIHLIRASQTATVLVGFSLILLADGLRKRRRRALHMTLALLIASAILNLSKGLDFEESSVACFLTIVLLAGRQAFDVPSRISVPRRALQHLLTFALLYYAYVLAGFLVLRRAIRPIPTLSDASLEPIRLLVGAPHFQYVTGHSVWFSRSLIVIGSIGALYALVQVLRPLVPIHVSTGSDLERARALIDRFGSDTLSYFSLQDGRSYFFEETGQAVLSYRLWGTVALVGGDPIGRPDRIGPLIRSFLAFADANGIDPCFLGVADEHAAAYRAAGLRFLKIGEEALVDVAAFDRERLKRKVRRAARHVSDLGMEAVRYRADQVPPDVRTQLEEISQRWVETKGGSEQGFSMTLGRLPRPSDTGCELLVAVQDAYVWGYLSFVPACGHRSWSLDAMRRRSDAPNGLMEFLVINAAEHYRDEGADTLSLNFATLSNAENDIPSRVLDGARHFLWEQLSTVYQLKSLYQFNSKFQPKWRSRYLAYRDVLKIPKLALAIAQTEAPLQLTSPISVFRRDS